MAKARGEQKLLLDIDTQKDFMEPGAPLFVPGADKIVGNLRKLVNWARDRGIRIISSADAHVPNDAEFRSFPPHCVQGTEGQKRIPETLLPDSITLPPSPSKQVGAKLLKEHSQVILEKRVLDMWSSPHAEAVFAAARPTRVYVMGVATEHCVKQAVDGLRERGYDTTVVTDAIAAVDKGAGDKAIREMVNSGARMATTQEVVGGAT